MYNVIHLVCVYAHPVESLIANGLPSLFPVFILKGRIHVVSFLVWIVIRFIETHEGHSGFEFKYSPFACLPMSAGSKYHNFHHLKNQGNYASFTTMWDTMFGTNETYYETQKDKKD